MKEIGHDDSPTAMFGQDVTKLIGIGAIKVLDKPYKCHILCLARNQAYLLVTKDIIKHKDSLLGIL